MKRKPKFYLKGWSITQKTEKEVDRIAERLQSNNSFALRHLVELGGERFDELERAKTANLPASLDGKEPA